MYDTKTQMRKSEIHSTAHKMNTRGSLKIKRKVLRSIVPLARPYAQAIRKVINLP